MEKPKAAKVIFAPKAIQDIQNTSTYIEEKGYPETAEKFSKKLYDFGSSLAVFPEKYPICRNEKLAKRNLRCAVFKDYAFIYKVVRRNLVIYNVIHGKRMR